MTIEIFSQIKRNGTDNLKFSSILHFYQEGLSLLNLTNKHIFERGIGFNLAVNVHRVILNLAVLVTLKILNVHNLCGTSFT